MKHRIVALALAVVPLLAATRLALPDLTSAVVVKGNATSLTIRIRNQGGAPSPAGLLNVSLGQPIGTAHNHPMPAIAAGQYGSVTVNVGQPLAGVHYTIRLDVNHAIAESNENNNAAAGTFP
jgi:subtilase family serine protease